MAPQADFLKLLFDKMMSLHLKHADTPDEWRFPRPSFKVARGPPAPRPALTPRDIESAAGARSSARTPRRPGVMSDRLVGSLGAFV